MKKFFVSGNTVKIGNIDESTVLDRLPAKVYTVGVNMFGMYLTAVKDRFETPKELYGSINRRAEKVISTYESRENSTGILLTGTKGSGKTMLSTVIANRMIDQGLPVITINESFNGDDFTSFIDSIGECVLIFDEFGKTYQITDEDDQQNGLLTMFDGLSKQKRLVILTENKEHMINDYMLKRPGRIFYHFRYDKLDSETTREYCESVGVDADTTAAIVKMSSGMLTFSFDILKAIVDEYMRYGGDVEELAEDLNIGFIRESEEKILISALIDKETGEHMDITENVIHKPSHRRNLYINYAQKDEAGTEYKDITGFGMSQIKFSDDQRIVYDNGDYILVCEPMETVYTDYAQYAA